MIVSLIKKEKKGTMWGNISHIIKESLRQEESLAVLTAYVRVGKCESDPNSPWS